MDGGFCSLYRLSSLEFLGCGGWISAPLSESHSFLGDPTGWRGRTQIASSSSTIPTLQTPQNPVRPLKPLSLDRKGAEGIALHCTTPPPAPSKNLPPNPQACKHPHVPTSLLKSKTQIQTNQRTSSPFPPEKAGRTEFVPYPLQTVFRLRSTPSIPSHPHSTYMIFPNIPPFRLR